MKIKSYKELLVWQKAMKLAVEVYLVSQKFPQSELYGLTSQMRRSAFSVPSNIAEGHARAFLKEYLQFLKIAYGSAAELETQLIITKEIKILDSNSFEVLMSDLNEVQKMLNGLIISLKRLKPST